MNLGIITVPGYGNGDKFSELIIEFAHVTQTSDTSNECHTSGQVVNQGKKNTNLHILRTGWVPRICHSRPTVDYFLCGMKARIKLYAYLRVSLDNTPPSPDKNNVIIQKKKKIHCVLYDDIKFLFVQKSTVEKTST